MKLLSKRYAEATQDMLCGSTQNLWDRFQKVFTPDERKQHVYFVWLAYRNIKIETGDVYVQYTFMDENGETHYLNAKIITDDYMRKHRLYPLIEELFYN